MQAARNQRPIIFIEYGHAYRISSHDSHTSMEILPEMYLADPEMRAVLYIKFTEESVPHINCVRVRAKDPDILFTLLYVYCVKSFTVEKIIMDTGHGLQAVTDLANNYDQNYISLLLTLCIQWVRLYFSLQEKRKNPPNQKHEYKFKIHQRVWQNGRKNGAQKTHLHLKD